MVERRFVAPQIRVRFLARGRVSRSYSVPGYSSGLSLGFSPATMRCRVGRGMCVAFSKRLYPYPALLSARISA